MMNEDETNEEGSHQIVKKIKAGDCHLSIL